VPRTVEAPTRFPISPRVCYHARPPSSRLRVSFYPFPMWSCSGPRTLDMSNFPTHHASPAAMLTVSFVFFALAISFSGHTESSRCARSHVDAAWCLLLHHDSGKQDVRWLSRRDMITYLQQTLKECAEGQMTDRNIVQDDLAADGEQADSMTPDRISKWQKPAVKSSPHSSIGFPLPSDRTGNSDHHERQTQPCLYTKASEQDCPL
jgi:hypothetical protein